MKQLLPINIVRLFVGCLFVCCDKNDFIAFDIFVLFL